MTIASTHTEYITERIFLEYLKKGVILTADQLEEKLKEYKVAHPNLSRPVSSFGDFDVERGGESSAELIKTISSSVSDDITIVSRELKNLVGISQSYYERWSIELQRLLNKAKRLEHDIDSLLLLKQDTAGYFAHVGDVFADANKVDISNTNAKIDIKESIVTLNPYSEYPQDSSGGSRIDLGYLTEYDVTFSILSTTPIGYTNTGNTTPLNAFITPTTDGPSWVGQVIKNTPGEVTAELKVRLSLEKDLEVSRILYDVGTQSTGGSCTITCQWSTDGYEWFMVDDVNPTKSLQGNNISWIFPITNMRWVKFLIVKNNYDFNASDSYEYDFGARSIRLYGHQYTVDNESVFQSTAQQPVDAEGEPVVFTTAFFEACETHGLDDSGTQVTDIDYYIAASEDGSTNWTEWVQVSPPTRENPAHPSAILFGGFRKLDNMNIISSTSSLIKKFDDTIDLNKITRTFDWGSTDDTRYLGYNFKNPDFAVVNTVVPMTVDPTDSDSARLNPNYLGNTVEVWRNVFDSTEPGKKVRDCNAGWGFENNEYYCSFYVVSSQGIVLDLGDTECIIDGIKRTGEIKIYRGIHTFRTQQENWNDFYESSNQYNNIDTDVQLAAVDPLYPYNHKMLIEGFTYSNKFNGEKIYNGVDILSQYYAIKTSAFDLENNIPKEDSIKYFAFVKGVGSDEIPSCGVLLRRDLDYNDYSDELCRVTWRPGEGKYRYLRMKAEFTSTDFTKTSTLYSYRIKAGV